MTGCLIIRPATGIEPNCSFDGRSPVPTAVTDVTTLRAALKGIMGEGLGIDGRRFHVAINEGDGEDGGVVEGLGLADMFEVAAALRPGEAGGVPAGVEAADVRPKNMEEPMLVPDTDDE